MLGKRKITEKSPARGVATDAPEFRLNLKRHRKASPADCAELLEFAETHTYQAASDLNHQLSLSISSLLARVDERDKDEEPVTIRLDGIRDISFATFQFLCTEFMTTMGEEDVKCLEDQGCLRVPIRGIMVEMIKQYFRHIQPVLPLFDEAMFWT